MAPAIVAERAEAGQTVAIQFDVSSPAARPLWGSRGSPSPSYDAGPRRAPSLVRRLILRRMQSARCGGWDSAVNPEVWV